MFDRLSRWSIGPSWWTTPLTWPGRTALPHQVGLQWLNPPHSYPCVGGCVCVSVKQWGVTSMRWYCSLVDNILSHIYYTLHNNLKLRTARCVCVCLSVCMRLCSCVCVCVCVCARVCIICHFVFPRSSFITFQWAKNCIPFSWSHFYTIHFVFQIAKRSMVISALLRTHHSEQMKDDTYFAFLIAFWWRGDTVSQRIPPIICHSPHFYNIDDSCAEPMCPGRGERERERG